MCFIHYQSICLNIIVTLKTCVVYNVTVCVTHDLKKHVLNTCMQLSENVCCENVCHHDKMKTHVAIKTCVTTKTCVVKTCVVILKTCVTKTCVRVVTRYS